MAMSPRRCSTFASSAPGNAKKHRGNYKKHHRIAHSEMCKLQSALSAAREDSAALRGEINKACKAIKLVTQLKKMAQKKLSKEKLFTRRL